MASTKTIDCLPDELLLEILGYVSNEELAKNVQYVSTKWQALIRDASLWKNYTFIPTGMDTREVLAMLVQMPCLKSFNFSTCEFDDIAIALSDTCKQLTTLSYTHEDSRDLSRYLARFCNLESLHIDPSCLLKIMTRHEACPSFPKIHHLKCTASYKTIGALELKLRNASFRSLRDVELMAVEHSQVIARLLEDNASSLVKVKVWGVDSKVLSAVLKCDKLEELKLDFASRICDTLKSSLPLIGAMKHLRVLSLRLFVDASNNILCSLFAGNDLRNLTELDLAHCMNFSRDVAAGITRCCPELQTLNLQACVNLDDLCLEQLAKCCQLQVLNVSGTLKVTEMGLVHLTGCKRLHTLHLVWLGGINSAMLKCLGGCAGLRKLYLDFNEVSEEDLVHTVRRLPSLVLLNVYRCPGVDPNRLQQSLRTVRIAVAKPSVSTW